MEQHGCEGWSSMIRVPNLLPPSPSLVPLDKLLLAQTSGSYAVKRLFANLKGSIVIVEVKEVVRIELSSALSFATILARPPTRILRVQQFPKNHLLTAFVHMLDHKRTSTAFIEDHICVFIHFSVLCSFSGMALSIWV